MCQTLAFLCGVVTMLGFNEPDFWKDFWPNFWSNLFADIIVGIILVSLIAWVSRKRQRFSAAVEVRVEEAGTRVFRFLFRIANNGNVVIKSEELYFHIFINQSIYKSVQAIPRSVHPVQAETEIDGAKYYHYFGILSNPAFPDRNVELFTISGEITGNGLTDMYYYLSTIYGNLPKSMRGRKAELVPHKLGRIRLQNADITFNKGIE